MDEEMDVATCSLASSDSEAMNDESTRNPEKNFVETDYRLKFESESSSDSDSKLQSQVVKISNNIKTDVDFKEPAERHYSNIRKRSRSNSLDRRDFRRGRRSPSYDDYKNKKQNRNSNMNFRNGSGNSDQKSSSSQDEFWKSRRAERETICNHELRRIWGYSPTHADLEQVFADHEALKKQAETDESIGPEILKQKLSKRKNKSVSSSSEEDASESMSSDSSVERKKKHKKKKSKKSKKHKKQSKKSKKSSKDKKKRKRNVSSSGLSDSDDMADKKRLKNGKPKSKTSKENDEWIELTKELREKQTQQTKDEEALVIGPQIPAHLYQKANSPIGDAALESKDRKNMLRGEAAAMAAYAAQGKRIPRRGEIGLTSGEISEFEKVGYVMSGTRHKSMEATRLRKEDQILTAEEKRLLNNFSQDHRRNREETVLNQFRELIASKKSKN